MSRKPSWKKNTLGNNLDGWNRRFNDLGNVVDFYINCDGIMMLRTMYC